jgi:galactosylceramidase
VQIGAFEAHPETGNASNTVMRQMVPQLPIGWSDHGSNGPMTLIGMREWQDLTVSVDFKLVKTEESKETT